MKKITNINIKNKKVLIRVDYNVPIEDGKIKNDFRIKASFPTIQYCLSQNASIILMTHLGRPKNKNNKYSLEPLVQYLKDFLNVFVHFSKDCISSESIKRSKNMHSKEIHLLENLRFYNDEINNDTAFAKKLSQHADVYVNDAFGTSHRSHASNSSILSFFENKCFGFLIDKEINYLSSNLINKKNKYTLLLGGAKISTKIKFIKNFIDKSSHILIGGGMAFTFLKAKNINIGKSLIEDEMITVAKEILNEAKNKNVQIVLPVDVVCAKSLNDSNVTICDINTIDNDKMGLDIGPETCMLFNMIIENSKYIIWNGPLGAFEYMSFATGTQSVASSIKQSTKYNKLISIVGGGDTVRAIESFSSLDAFTHISTGGGASLKLLSGEKLEIFNTLEKYES